MIEKRYRSIVKAISYRCVGTLGTIIVSYIIIGKVNIALSLGIADLIVKTALFYLHERIWNKIKIGKITTPIDYNI